MQTWKGIFYTMQIWEINSVPPGSYISCATTLLLHFLTARKVHAVARKTDWTTDSFWLPRGHKSAQAREYFPPLLPLFMQSLGKNNLDTDWKWQLPAIPTPVLISPLRSSFLWRLEVYGPRKCKRSPLKSKWWMTRRWERERGNGPHEWHFPGLGK